MASSPAQPSHRFVAPTWMRATSVLAFALFAAACTHEFLANGGTVTAWVLMGLAVLGALGIAEVVTARVDLYPERIVIVSNLRKSAFPRGSFVRASWAKGVSVTLERSDGSFLKLPDVGGNSQGLTNSLRAWIKRSRVET